MTKKEIRRQINERFYLYVEGNFPQYNIDHNEGGGRVYLIHKDMNDSIEYTQSDHTVCQFSYASSESKKDCNQMEKYLKEIIIPYVEWLSV
jgi:hypothetical protein